jgi:hypothetical protein
MLHRKKEQERIASENSQENKSQNSQSTPDHPIPEPYKDVNYIVDDFIVDNNPSSTMEEDFFTKTP